MTRKTAFITGITGQDGSYLAELLLEEGYEVHGLVRRVALEDPIGRMSRIAHLLDRVTLHAGSPENYASVYEAIKKVSPDECYHLAAHSYVSYSFDEELTTLNTNINSTLYLLGSIRSVAPECRFYFAGSSEMFGHATEVPQNELTRFRPRSAYGISKIAGYELTRNYRETYGIFAASGILFNHESPRRGREFVTRKITSAVARIASGKASELRLGNLNAVRDWGHAREYVRAMWLMLQQPEAGDFVIATGKTHTVRQFVETAFRSVGLNADDYVVIDERLYRATEQNALVGDPSKARHVLGWEASIPFDDMIGEMVAFDRALLADTGSFIQHGNS
jgi:GDPmannose 4,6-dehydratase